MKFKQIDENDELDLLELYPKQSFGNGARANMVIALDGSVSIRGRSAGLSSPLDKKIFSHLRAVSSAIVVGAKTAKNERYGPPLMTPIQQELRRSIGLSPTVALILLASSGRDFSWTERLSNNDDLVSILVIGADKSSLPSTNSGVRFLSTAPGDLGYSQAIKFCRSEFGNNLLCEGGPKLLGKLADLGEISELCLTISHLLPRSPHTGLFPSSELGALSCTTHQVLSSKSASYLRLGVCSTRQYRIPNNR